MYTYMYIHDSTTSTAIETICVDSRNARSPKLRQRTEKLVVLRIAPQI